MRARIIAAALAGVLLVACGGDGGGAPPGGAVTGVVRGGVIALPVSIDHTAAQPFILDTGSVVTRIDPSRFGSLGLEPGFDRVMTLDVGEVVHLSDVDVFAGSLCSMMMCRGSEPAGLLGGAQLLELQVTIDYRQSAVTFGAFMAPMGLGAAVTAPFALEGGGQRTVEGRTLTAPATRIALDVELEGRTAHMVLDTGSTAIVLRPDVYDALVADGRAESSADIATVMGTLNVRTSFVRDVSVAGATQPHIEAARSPLPIDLLEEEVGHSVDGLLGGAYLQHYATTIDYPARVLTLRPYE